MVSDISKNGHFLNKKAHKDKQNRLSLWALHMASFCGQLGHIFRPVRDTISGQLNFKPSSLMPRKVLYMSSS